MKIKVLQESIIRVKSSNTKVEAKKSPKRKKYWKSESQIILKKKSIGRVKSDKTKKGIARVKSSKTKKGIARVKSSKTKKYYKSQIK